MSKRTDSKNCSNYNKKELKNDGLKRDKMKQNKRSSTRSQRQAAEIENNAVKMSQENDYGWHSKFPFFSKDASTFPFATPLGGALQTVTGDKITVPGVMCLRFIPTIGYSADKTSAVNRSASRFKSYLRSVQKASADYDSADIMIQLMAVDSLLTFHEMCVRAYETVNLWTPTNRYYPEALLLAAGIDPSIRFEAEQFRGFINQLGINLTKFVMPNNFDINFRHQWMTEGYYLDGNTNRAQTYMFAPEGFWIYDNTAATGSQLNWVKMNDSTNAAKLPDLIALATSMLNALSNDDDVDTINGDLFAAYGQSGLKPIQEVKELQTIIPKYDPVVLSMIENATLTGGFDPSYTPIIYQDPSVNGNGLLFTPTFAGNPIGNINKYCLNATGTQPGAVLNMHLDHPSPEAVMEATRWMVCSSQQIYANTTAGTYSPDIFGSDVVTTMNIYYYNPENLASGVQRLRYYSNTIPGSLDESQSFLNWTSVIQLLAMVQNFDWAPFLYLTNQTGTGSTVTPNILSILGDVDNITAVSAQQLNWIHEASLLSLFDVPEFAGRIERSGNSV